MYFIYCTHTYLSTQLAPKDCVKVLVGTCTPVEESDSSGGKMVSTQVAEAYAAQKGLTYVECNPLDSEAVSRVINHLLAQVVRQWGTDTITRGENHCVNTTAMIRSMLQPHQGDGGAQYLLNSRPHTAQISSCSRRVLTWCMCI